MLVVNNSCPLHCSPQGCSNELITSATSESGDVDPFDALRFSLRSIRKNLPFVKKIFLVTASQKPDWLQETEELEVVPHSSFTEGNRTLFDGTVVEANIGRVEKAGECFIYIRKPYPPSIHIPMKPTVVC